MEAGRIKVDQQKKQYDFEIKGAKVLLQVVVSNLSIVSVMEQIF